jgi:hypothetical protein
MTSAVLYGCVSGFLGAGRTTAVAETSGRDCFRPPRPVPRRRLAFTGREA